LLKEYEEYSEDMENAKKINMVKKKLNLMRIVSH